MPSYGNTGYVDDKFYSSDAERDFIHLIAPMMQSGEITYFVWQPPPIDDYHPDAFLRWDSGDEWYAEIKNQRIEQMSANKMKRFCLQNPDKHLVLVWFGRIHKKGPTKRRLDMLLPHLHHVWYVK